MRTPVVLQSAPAGQTWCPPHVLPTCCPMPCWPPPARALQINYRTVFFWEYLGPLLVYPLFYFLPHLFYGDVK